MFIKTIFLSLLTLSSLYATEVYVDVDSAEGKQIFKDNLHYREYVAAEKNKLKTIQAAEKRSKDNLCEIVKLKKIIAKLLKEKALNKNLGKGSNENLAAKPIPVIATEIEKDIPKSVFKTERPLKKKNKCVEKTKRVVDTTNIWESYISFPKPVKFIVDTKKAGIFNYPLVESKVISMLHKKDTFYADMYTKAGWVHNVNGGWVKGYRLYPKVNNRVTKRDVERWHLQYKTIKVKCDKQGE